MCSEGARRDQVTRTKGPVMAPCAAVGTQQGECVREGRTLAVFGECSRHWAEVPGSSGSGGAGLNIEGEGDDKNRRGLIPSDE